ncbi:hypothetical protein RhiirA5_493614 [Rhizophagus irregularis]|uniref:UBA domain-containing protein n=4 Tax=Rhizophagus irregularis TaxID=588596 RepID=A0A2I1DWR3_9GLOM|nr:hypothetical protein GLOIN_2v1696310 [Rhizophagus irregularis DAOM 181602=DAOM 197198]EXX69815.1 hypothetical protein RirG_092860 [Rhizophagus irregularis DAOM 197198w]PKC16634.1 hypothetical protein RhiirA5_493614 [Rhizophagus irregularis]PKC72831.1 hypothetical protein RhiirA1_489975 [Rhizophagus irregularis]PKY14309.1 hypothetical protein RhiirB3_465984 [Rhizophagus irregularis]POG62401.1 hypothetical protein GLOIN_2v1696310 [Rhizophagus irregularis DAOM 181602=DAOM 197198]|eukprot:XP_025169267.1 hypothetical protein GLOIN_2v1696310 [Rhizophagus irregularis DAOM 181602=DAOM 197198]
MSTTKVLKNLNIVLDLSLPPNNNPIKLTITVKKGQLLLDVVRQFMMENNIPCYLELSILSTIEALILESLRKDMEIDAKVKNESEADQIRSELVAKYQKHTVRFNDAPAEDIFPKAYHTLVHSPVPSIFDTFVQLEYNYKQALKDFISKREKKISDISEQHLKEVESMAESNNRLDDGVMERQIEEVEFLKVTLISELEEIQRLQKKEYCNFVLKLYEAHQRLLTEQQCNTMDVNLVFRLDGREIVSEVINEMKREEKENQTDKLSKELLKLENKSTNGSKSAGNRSRAGSISSLADVVCSPTLSPINMNNFDEKLTGNGNENINEYDSLSIEKIKELGLGFTVDQAKTALEMTNRNLEQALELLIENLDKVNAQIANGTSIPPIPRRSSTPIISQTQQQSLRRTKSSGRQLQITAHQNQKQEKKGWTPMMFLQQKNMTTQSQNSSVKKLSVWFNRAMENFGFEEGNGNGNNIMDDSRLVESFTISLGNQVKVTHNLRLLVSDMDELLEYSNEPTRNMAYIAQTAANLYSQDLTAIILLLTPRDWPKYKLGKSANKKFFERCNETTEFHFDKVETQLEAIENDYPIDSSSLKEGDFFITRHSNLPLVHVVFHLVIDFESIQKSELTYRSRVIDGLRNILRTVNRFDISTISLPFLMLPSDVDVFSDPNLDEKLLYRRGELVLKCTKGFMIENSRLPKHVTAKENDAKTVSFLLPKTANEQQFHEFRHLLTMIFRAS